MSTRISLHRITRILECKIRLRKRFTALREINFRAFYKRNYRIINQPSRRFGFIAILPPLPSLSLSLSIPRILAEPDVAMQRYPRAANSLASVTANRAVLLAVCRSRHIR